MKVMTTMSSPSLYLKRKKAMATMLFFSFHKAKHREKGNNNVPLLCFYLYLRRRKHRPSSSSSSLI
jgi:hypothetical protein